MINNLDWAGWFMTMSHKLSKCKSEEFMYQTLKDFKAEFNTEYGKLSRAKRKTKGFRDIINSEPHECD